MAGADKTIYELQHYTQKSSWDCGLSCIFMVLPPRQKEALQQNLEAWCAEELKCRSTWTIDLCYILQRCQVNHQYCTKTPGIDQNFAKESFYRKSINQDEVRVTERFQNASANGVNIKVTSLALTALLGHLENYGPAIVLIDTSTLNCSTCTSFSGAIRSFLKHVVNFKIPFSGHYVVLCGMDWRKKLIFYRDPALRDKMCQTTFTHFEKAWKAYGTDDDVILINPPLETDAAE